jgi:tRNA threonylcarbamoyl adenosine modification protein YeaZ
MKTDKNIVLAIETAVEGGSLSILEGQTEIAVWSGTKAVSKAEDVLEQIAELLKSNKIEKHALKYIAVSNGPGSSTGIKIGLSIAKGLGNALKIPVREISASEALLGECEEALQGITITALPIGKNLICRQIFDKGESVRTFELQNPATLSFEEFRLELVKLNYDRIIFHKKVAEYIDVIFKLVITSNNLAYLVGNAANKNIASDNK